jgi:putative salt-induced outer membrane protein YdiY
MAAPPVGAPEELPFAGWLPDGGQAGPPNGHGGPTEPSGPPTWDSGGPSSVPPTATEPLDTLDESAWYDGPWWIPEGWEEWFLKKLWSGGLEVGVNSTEGNAEAFSLRVGGNLKRKTAVWELKSDLIYAKSTTHGMETQHNAIFNGGYERSFGEGVWSHFGKLNLEYDEFKAFDLRVVMNMGFGYRLVHNDATTLNSRFGAGVSHEVNSPDARWVPEAVLGADLNHTISSRQKLAVTIDYFPEWGDFSQYRLVTDASWVLALDDASKMSIKLSVNERYDSTPNGRKPLDVIYALLLIWQL